MSQTPSTDRQGPGSEGGRKGPFGKVWLFFRQVFDELRKVVVPTRRELVNYTLVVLVFVIIVILIVTGLDWVFSRGAEYVFGGGGIGGGEQPPVDVEPGDGGAGLDVEDLGIGDDVEVVEEGAEGEDADGE